MDPLRAQQAKMADLEKRLSSMTDQIEKISYKVVRNIAAIEQIFVAVDQIFSAFKVQSKVNSLVSNDLNEVEKEIACYRGRCGDINCETAAKARGTFKSLHQDAAHEG